MQKQGTEMSINDIIHPLTRNLTEMLLKTANGISENAPNKISFLFQKRSARSTSLE